jgi:sugar lactone lactonase YvrE
LQIGRGAIGHSYLWNALWGSNQLVRYASDGAVEHVLEVPVSQPAPK